jgi:hypothetical protein
MTEIGAIVPKRGGIHPTYGLYIGGSKLNDTYHQTSRIKYWYASQQRNPKTIMSLEHILTSARDSTTTLKFDGRLEPIVGSSTEIGKEDFVDLLKENVKEFGQETFYYVKAQETSPLNY